MLENKLMNGSGAMRNALGICSATALFATGVAYGQASFFGGPALGGTPAVLEQASGTIASTTTGSHVWTHSTGSDSWIGTNVAVGDHGRLVLSQFQGLHGSTRLFHAEDANPPTPIWENNATYMTMSTRVDAAERADILATLCFSQDSASAARVPVLALYSSASSTPLWKYPFPFTVTMPNSGVHVSANGETIVAWVFDYGTLSTAVAVFGRHSNTPRSFTNLSTSGLPIAVELSAEGSSLYVASAIKTMVLDVAQGAIAYESYNTQTLSLGHAISSDGSVFARGLSNRTVAAYRKVGATYVPWFTYALDTDASCQSLAISEDGSTMACGYNYGYPYLQVRTVVLDITAGTPNVVLDESVIGGGTWINTISDLVLSASGDTLAVGLTGDQDGIAPEVLVYAKDPTASTWGRIYQYDLPGSVNDVDLSADGTRIAVASKAVHMMIGGSGGRLDTFQISPVVATADLTWEGVPSIGNTLYFHHSGLTPGSAAQLLGSEEFASPPLNFPGVGTLYLRRDRITVAAIGNADQNGVFTSSITIPLDESEIGNTYYVQSMGMEPSQLSQTWLSITIQP